MKVKYIPFQPHCFAFGGFEIQMLSTLDAVVKSGVDAEKIDVWSRDNNFDILHCWGLGFHHYENIRWARHANKKVVITALLSYYESIIERLRHSVSTHIKKAQYLIQIANMADAVVVLNELQADACQKYFRVPISRIHVIPNVVHRIFYRDTLRASSVDFNGISNFVITVGSVCERKNQLKLVKACKEIGKRLVIIGKVLDGEGTYGHRIKEEIEGRSDIIWIEGLPPNSKELALAYQASSLVALPSYVEQQPISLLEGVASGKPLLAANRAYARQKFFENAVLVNPDSIQSIADGIQKAFSRPQQFTVPYGVIEECEELKVGLKYRELYKLILGKS